MWYDPISVWLSNPIIVGVLSILLSIIITYITVPKVIKRMIDAGFVGRDVNKKGDVMVPEMGGIAALLGIGVSVTLLGGAIVLFDVYDNVTTIYVVLSVMFIASYVGLFDDISVVSRRMKAIAVFIAGLPLAVARPVDPIIIVPFMTHISFAHPWPLYVIFWSVIVPFGVSAAANAYNMSAGYNGLESGQGVIISCVMLIVTYIMGRDTVGPLIFGAVLGGTIVLYYFNRYPARMFIGDVGTLSIGAMIGAGAILTGLEIFAIIAIAPMFYEGVVTAYYAAKGIERRDACMNPVILGDGRLKPPKGAERYTLAYYLLSKRPMTEKQLVTKMLMLYLVSGIGAIALAIIAVILGV